MKDIYKKQAALLLDILPEIEMEKIFGLHGGTAINLFYFDMPRLSIDIDLTYIPFSNVTTVSTGQLWGGKVNAALDRQHPRDLFDMRNLFNEIGYTG